jgi:hypothetical protein
MLKIHFKTIKHLNPGYSNPSCQPRLWFQLLLLFSGSLQSFLTDIFVVSNLLNVPFVIIQRCTSAPYRGECSCICTKMLSHHLNPNSLRCKLYKCIVVIYIHAMSYIFCSTYTYIVLILLKPCHIKCNCNCG